MSGRWVDERCVRERELTHTCARTGSMSRASQLQQAPEDWSATLVPVIILFVTTNQRSWSSSFVGVMVIGPSTSLLPVLPNKLESTSDVQKHIVCVCVMCRHATLSKANHAQGIPAMHKNTCPNTQGSSAARHSLCRPCMFQPRPPSTKKVVGPSSCHKKHQEGK